MQQINNLSDDADQLVTFALPDGSLLTMELFYRAGIGRWTMNLDHETLSLRNLNVTVGPNLLRPWKNLVAFGIAVLSATGLDPLQPTDFLDEIVTINMLSAEEVQQVEDEVLNARPLEDA